MGSVSPDSQEDAQETRAKPRLPLEGVVVLDLTQIYNGPYATFLMAQAGAKVIKVEPPDGEYIRRRKRAGGPTEPVAVLNSNKLAMAVDLKTAEGLDLFLSLVPKADVVVENFAPGVMERLGIGADTLRAINPRLIVASSSGYGSVGPYKDYPAMDLTVQAMSGVLSVTGFPDGPSIKAGPAICDFFAGAHLYGAIVTALHGRTATGEGAEVEVSMMSAVYPSLLSNISMAKLDSPRTVRTGNRHGGLAMAPYNVYPTQDGAIAILSANEGHWRALAGVFGRQEWLADPRFATVRERSQNMDPLDEALSSETARFKRDELMHLLLDARVPCAPVRELAEVMLDEHLHSTGMLKWIEHPEFGRVLVHGSPLVFKGVPAPPYEPSRPVGTDTQRVLQELLGTPPAF